VYTVEGVTETDCEAEPAGTDPELWHVERPVTAIVAPPGSVTPNASSIFVIAKAEFGNG
jgi:hypothetical protein